MCLCMHFSVVFCAHVGEYSWGGVRALSPPYLQELTFALYPSLSCNPEGTRMRHWVEPWGFPSRSKVGCSDVSLETRWAVLWLWQRSKLGLCLQWWQRKDEGEEGFWKGWKMPPAGKICHSSHLLFQMQPSLNVRIQFSLWRFWVSVIQSRAGWSFKVGRVRVLSWLPQTSPNFVLKIYKHNDACQHLCKTHQEFLNKIKPLQASIIKQLMNSLVGHFVGSRQHYRAISVTN